MALSTILYSALPFSFFHPFRFFPLKRGSQFCAPQKANNDTQENEVGGQEIPKVDKKSGQETLKGGQEILNDTKNDTRNDTSKDTSYSYLDKYAMLQENIEKETDTVDDEGGVNRFKIIKSPGLPSGDS